MGRHARTYTGEKRSVHLGVQLTPSERRELESAAESAGATVSNYVREICLRGAAPVVAGARRNPQARRLMRELNALGNNLNQLSRRANIHGSVPEESGLRETLELLKAAMARVIAL